MEVKTLTLLEMLQLHDILYKYVPDTEDSLEFINIIVNNMPPMDYSKCIFLFTGIPIEMMKREESIDYLTAFVQGLSQNRYLEFLAVAKGLGL